MTATLVPPISLQDSPCSHGSGPIASARGQMLSARAQVGSDHQHILATNWQKDLLDLHRVLSCCRDLYLLQHHYSEAVLRVGLEIIMCSVSKQALWWVEGWWQDEERRNWFKAVVREKLAVVLNSKGLTLKAVEAVKTEEQEIVAKLQTQNRSLEEQLNKARKAQQIAEQQLQAVKNEEDTHKANIQALERSIDKLQHKLKDIQTVSASQEEEIQALQKAVHDAEQSRANAEKTLSTVEAQLQAANAQLLAESNVEHQRVEELEKKLSETERTIAESAKEIKELNKRIGFETTQTRRTQEALNNLQRKMVTEEEMLKVKIDELHTALKEQQRATRDASKQTKAEAERAHHLELELEKKTHEMQHLVAELHQMKSTYLERSKVQAAVLLEGAEPQMHKSPSSRLESKLKSPMPSARGGKGQLRSHAHALAAGEVRERGVQVEDDLLEEAPQAQAHADQPKENLEDPKIAELLLEQQALQFTKHGLEKEVKHLREQLESLLQNPEGGTRLSAAQAAYEESAKQFQDAQKKGADCFMRLYYDAKRRLAKKKVEDEERPNSRPVGADDGSPHGSIAGQSSAGSPFGVVGMNMAGAESGLMSRNISMRSLAHVAMVSSAASSRASTPSLASRLTSQLSRPCSVSGTGFGGIADANRGLDSRMSSSRTRPNSRGSMIMGGAFSSKAPSTADSAQAIRDRVPDTLLEEGMVTVANSLPQRGQQQLPPSLPLPLRSGNDDCHNSVIEKERQTEAAEAEASEGGGKGMSPGLSTSGSIAHQQEPAHPTNSVKFAPATHADSMRREGTQQGKQQQKDIEELQQDQQKHQDQQQQRQRHDQQHDEDQEQGNQQQKEEGERQNQMHENEQEQEEHQQPGDGQQQEYRQQEEKEPQEEQEKQEEKEQQEGKEQQEEQQEQQQQAQQTDQQEQKQEHQQLEAEEEDGLKSKGSSAEGAVAATQPPQPEQRVSAVSAGGSPEACAKREVPQPKAQPSQSNPGADHAASGSVMADAPTLGRSHNSKRRLIVAAKPTSSLSGEPGKVVEPEVIVPAASQLRSGTPAAQTRAASSHEVAGAAKSGARSGGLRKEMDRHRAATKPAGGGGGGSAPPTRAAPSLSSAAGRGGHTAASERQGQASSAGSSLAHEGGHSAAGHLAGSVVAGGAAGGVEDSARQSAEEAARNTKPSENAVKPLSKHDGKELLGRGQVKSNSGRASIEEKGKENAQKVGVDAGGDTAARLERLRTTTPSPEEGRILQAGPYLSAEARVRELVDSRVLPSEVLDIAVRRLQQAMKERGSMSVPVRSARASSPEQAKLLGGRRPHTQESSALYSQIIHQDSGGDSSRPSAVTTRASSPGSTAPRHLWFNQPTKALLYNTSMPDLGSFEASSHLRGKGLGVGKPLGRLMRDGQRSAQVADGESRDRLAAGGSSGSRSKKFGEEVIAALAADDIEALAAKICRAVSLPALEDGGGAHISLQYPQPYSETELAEMMVRSWLGQRGDRRSLSPQSSRRGQPPRCRTAPGCPRGSAGPGAMVSGSRSRTPSPEEEWDELRRFKLAAARRAMRPGLPAVRSMSSFVTMRAATPGTAASRHTGGHAGRQGTKLSGPLVSLSVAGCQQK